MNLNISTIQTAVTLIGLIGSAVLFIAYIRVKNKTGIDRAKNDTILTLNQLNEIQKKKIDLLQSNITELGAQVGNMQTQIDDLVKRRDFTDTLLKESLIEYYSKHKDLAKTVDRMTN